MHGLSRSQFFFQSYLRLGCGAQADGRYHFHVYFVLWERVSLSSYVECTADDCAVTPFNLLTACTLFLLRSHWAPEFHMDDLRCMKSNSKIPCNVHTEYIEELTHDFIVHLDQVDQAVSFCVERIKCCGHVTVQHFRSRL